MHHHLDVPELGEDEGACAFLASADVKTVLVLLEGEASIAQVRAEAGIPWLLAFLDAPEKAVKGPIYPLEDVLQDLRVHLGQVRADLFAGGQWSRIAASSQSKCLPCGRHPGVLAGRRYRSHSTEQATCSAWFVVFLSGRVGSETSCSSLGDILLEASTTGNCPFPAPHKERAFHPHHWK